MAQPGEKWETVTKEGRRSKMERQAPPPKAKKQKKAQSGNEEDWDEDDGVVIGANFVGGDKAAKPKKKEKEEDKKKKKPAKPAPKPQQQQQNTPLLQALQKQEKGKKPAEKKETTTQKWVEEISSLKERFPKIGSRIKVGAETVEAAFRGTPHEMDGQDGDFEGFMSLPLSVAGATESGRELLQAIEDHANQLAIDAAEQNRHHDLVGGCALLVLNCFGTKCNNPVALATGPPGSKANSVSLLSHFGTRLYLQITLQAAGATSLRGNFDTISTLFEEGLLRAGSSHAAGNLSWVLCQIAASDPSYAIGNWSLSALPVLMKTRDEDTRKNCLLGARQIITISQNSPIERRDARFRNGFDAPVTPKDLLASIDYFSHNPSPLLAAGDLVPYSVGYKPNCAKIYLTALLPQAHKTKGEVREEVLKMLARCLDASPEGASAAWKSRFTSDSGSSILLLEHLDKQWKDYKGLTREPMEGLMEALEGLVPNLPAAINGPQASKLIASLAKKSRSLPKEAARPQAVAPRAAVVSAAPKGAAVAKGGEGAAGEAAEGDEEYEGESENAVPPRSGGGKGPTWVATAFLLGLLVWVQRDNLTALLQ